MGQPFPLSSGIRQGCPLSPLLFVTVIDSFFRRLAKEVTDVVVRMFADDTGMVIPNVRRQIRTLERLFEELRIAANPRRNLSMNNQSLQEQLRQEAGDWQRMQLKSSGKYLSFVVGPGAADKVWAGPWAKLQAAARDWPWSDMGLH